jgi:HEPN domain-containing protein
MQSVKLAQLLLQKAKQDEYAIGRLLDDPLAPDEIIGFHAQQAVEKSAKSVLASRQIEYRRTHQLSELVELLTEHHIVIPQELSEAVILTPYAVELRYDLLPVPDDAGQALDRHWIKNCVAAIIAWAQSMVETNR